MNQNIARGLAVGLMLAGAVAVAQGAKKPPDAKRGEAVVKALAAGKFDQIEAQFDAAMAKALPESKLSAVWTQLQGQAGPFQAITGSRETTMQAHDVDRVECKFANVALQAVVAFDADGKIGGLSFHPAQ